MTPLKSQNFDFQVELFTSKISQRILILFLLKNIRLEVQLVIITFFDNFNFGIVLFFLKLGLILVDSNQKTI